MSEPQTTFITWQLFALGLLSVLQIIVISIFGWALGRILKMGGKIGKISSRVSHVEGHLEVTDRRGGVPFKRLEVKET